MTYYNVGKIVNTHGIRGEVRVMATTDFPEDRFQVGNTLYISQTNQQPVSVKIKTVRQHKQFILLTFDGMLDINQVEPFKNCELMITQDQQQDLEEGQYYYREIIGLAVETIDGEKLGAIKEILSPGANDVWVVKRAGQEDLLLPVIDQVIKEVQLDQHKVIVELMEGM